MPVSYERYREWCKALSDKDLNREILNARTRMNHAPKGSRARKAWRLMLETAEATARDRDTREIAQVNKYLAT